VRKWFGLTLHLGVSPVSGVSPALGWWGNIVSDWVGLLDLKTFLSSQAKYLPELTHFGLLRYVSEHGEQKRLPDIVFGFGFWGGEIPLDLKHYPLIGDVDDVPANGKPIRATFDGG
jgi:hypothetical protein